MSGEEEDESHCCNSELDLFLGVLQEDVNSLLLNFLLPCPFFLLLSMSFPLPHDMPGQLFG